MRKHGSTILFILLLMAGFGFLLYPTLSNAYNQKISLEAIEEYEAGLEENNTVSYEDVFALADDYNKQLAELPFPLEMAESCLSGYDDLLNVHQNGMFGYITINKINVRLPIYHGTSTDVMMKACGHIEGTSLPTGGIGNHTAISAHRGLPSARLFTDADKLEIGDLFTLHILDRTLTYEIDQIVSVDPSETQYLDIDPDQDYCTLVTCTPYGINTHRMLIRGVRTDKVEEKVVGLNAIDITDLVFGTAAGVTIVLFIWGIIYNIRKRRVQKRVR